MWYSAGKKAQRRHEHRVGLPRHRPSRTRSTATCTARSSSARTARTRSLYEADGTTVTDRRTSVVLARPPQRSTAASTTASVTRTATSSRTSRRLNTHAQRPELVGDRHGRAGVPDGLLGHRLARRRQRRRRHRRRPRRPGLRRLPQRRGALPRDAAVRDEDQRRTPAWRPASGSTRSTRASRRIESRTCPTYMPLGNPGAWRPFFADMEPARRARRWPLYRDAAATQRRQRRPELWSDPTPATTRTTPLHMIQYPARSGTPRLRAEPAAAAGAPAPAHDW